ncbi:MAG: NAD(P)/FAD-dependent oxidoreductase [Anaerolineales bacterium]
METYDVIVIGGGPAGLMAAGQAALVGSRTLLIEKMEQPGRKLLLTGKHRCNLTNSTPIPEAIAQFNREGRFLTQVFYQFYTTHLRAFFRDLGVPTVEQRGGRIFPASEDARDVRSALLGWVEKAGVVIRTQTRLERILVQDGIVQGVQTDGGEILAAAVILATGGKAYPGTGSTGEGLEAAREVGHTIRSLRPALVPVTTAGSTAQELQGLSLSNVLASVYIDSKLSNQLFGELMFTHFGLSGPVILTLSREIVQALEKDSQVEITIDLKPALSRETLDTRILRDIQLLGRKQFSTLLEGLLPRKLIPICVQQTGIPWDKKNSQLTSQEREQLIDWLKGNFKFRVTGHQGFEQAIITAGGINTREVDPHTMESKLIKGLYFAGEILDVDANTGGFNLQAAFSTGWAAGRSAGSTSGKHSQNKG